MPNDENWSDTQKLLAFCVVISFIVVVLIWMFHPPTGDAGSIAVLNTMVGTLAGLTGAIITFYFGSSKGSKDKDDTISSIATHENGTGNGGSTTSTATVTAPTATAPGSATVTVEPAAGTSSSPKAA